MQTNTVNNIIAKFGLNNLNAQCMTILGSNFHQVPELNMLIDEFNRLDELPSISIVSSPSVYNRMVFDNQYCLYKFDNNIDISELYNGEPRYTYVINLQ